MIGSLIYHRNAWNYWSSSRLATCVLKLVQVLNTSSDRQLTTGTNSRCSHIQSLILRINSRIPFALFKMDETNLFRTASCHPSIFPIDGRICLKKAKNATESSQPGQQTIQLKLMIFKLQPKRIPFIPCQDYLNLNRHYVDLKGFSEINNILSPRVGFN